MLNQLRSRYYKERDCVVVTFLETMHHLLAEALLHTVDASTVSERSPFGQ